MQKIIMNFLILDMEEVMGMNVVTFSVREG